MCHTTTISDVTVFCFKYSKQVISSLLVSAELYNVQTEAALRELENVLQNDTLRITIKGNEPNCDAKWRQVLSRVYCIPNTQTENLLKDLLDEVYGGFQLGCNAVLWDCMLC